MNFEKICRCCEGDLCFRILGSLCPLCEGRGVLEDCFNVIHQEFEIDKNTLHECLHVTFEVPIFSLFFENSCGKSVKIRHSTQDNLTCWNTHERELNEIYKIMSESGFANVEIFFDDKFMILGIVVDGKCQEEASSLEIAERIGLPRAPFVKLHSSLLKTQTSSVTIFRKDSIITQNSFNFRMTLFVYISKKIMPLDVCSSLVDKFSFLLDPAEGERFLALIVSTILLKAQVFCQVDAPEFRRAADAYARKLLENWYTKSPKIVHHAKL